jgi:2-phospho-L-lactate/phosphoenolpyruvate guanylyltransferase
MIVPERIALLVPVKDLTRAKSRLSPLLSLEERRELAWLLLEGTLRTLAAADSGGPRAVVTSYAPAMALARELGFAVLEEAQQVSESASVDAASAALQRDGLAGVLRIPLDLPLLRPEHLAPLLQAAREGAAAVLVPARDRLGTNALYRSPPTLFPSHFGPDSLTLHERAARAAAADVRVLPLEGFALDIDDPADAAELLRRGDACPAADYLRGLELAARLERVAREPA